ncbi:MAG: hypothetical protein ACREBU_25150 [Nitrososphaera sp.]
MNRKGIVNFFKPNLWIAVLTVVFIIMAVISQFQIWPSDAQAMGIPKPPFYDEFRPYHFVKHLWFFVSIPLLILSWVTIPRFFDPPLLEVFASLGAISVSIYCYLLSCAIRQTYRSITDNESWRRAQESNLPS